MSGGKTRRPGAGPTVEGVYGAGGRNGSPGKRTLTERRYGSVQAKPRDGAQAPGYRTGIESEEFGPEPHWDPGFVGALAERPCDAEDARGSEDCFLTEGQRSALHDEFVRRLHGAVDAFKSAIREERVVRRLKPDPGLVELLVDVLYVTGNIGMASLVKNVGSMPFTVARWQGGLRKTSWGFESIPAGEKTETPLKGPMDAVGSALSTALVQARTFAKSAAAKVTDESSRTQWLDQLEDSLSVQEQMIRNHAIALLTDSELYALTLYYDRQNHDLQRYRAELERVMSAYSRNVESVGYRTGSIRRVAVRVVGPHGRRQSRMALCEMLPDLASAEAEPFLLFKQWVNRGFERMAEERQTSLGGSMEVVYDSPRFRAGEWGKVPAREDEEVKAWLKASAPMFVRPTVDREGNERPGGVRWNDDYR